MVHIVDGARELADLLGGLHADRDDLRSRAAAAHDREFGGQVGVGHLQGIAAQPADRDDQRPGHAQR